MSSLTETSVVARKFIIWTIILAIAWMILRFIYSSLLGYLTKPVPPSLPPPDMKFGLLPEIAFPKTTPFPGFSVILENIEGRPPDSTPTAKIYLMPKKTASLLTIDKALKFASEKGFNSEPQILNPTYYYFIDSKIPYRSMLLDIVNLNFEIKYDYIHEKDNIFPSAVFTSKEESLINEIKNYASANYLFDSSLLREMPKIQYLRFNEGRFSEVYDQKNANAARINFFRNKIDGMELLTPNYDKSHNYIIYSPNPNIKYLEISSNFYPIDLSDFGTYPLKSSSNAWGELASGSAYIAKMGNNPEGKITVRSIYLAYFDSDQPQDFLQPIFVFEGDNGFIAYVQAVTGPSQ